MLDLLPSLLLGILFVALVVSVGWVIAAADDAVMSHQPWWSTTKGKICVPLTMLLFIALVISVSNTVLTLIRAA